MFQDRSFLDEFIHKDSPQQCPNVAIRFLKEEGALSYSGRDWFLGFSLSSGQVRGFDSM